MRTSEKAKIAEKYNNVLTKIEELDIEYCYSSFDAPRELDSDDEGYEIVEQCDDLDDALWNLEGDIESEIEKLKKALETVTKLRTDAEAVNKLCEKYAADKDYGCL